MPKPEEYVWIKKWGELVVSGRSYIRDQQHLAAEDAAPLDAIYARQGGGWATLDDVTGANTRARLGLPPLPPEPTLIEQIYELVRDDPSDLGVRVRALIDASRK